MCVVFERDRCPLISFFFSSRRRHTSSLCDWSSDVCSSDLRRQRDLDAGGHLLACRWCARLSEPLLDRRRTAAVAGEVRIPIQIDADVVTARKQGRELAAQAGFSATELTIIATA